MRERVEGMLKKLGKRELHKAYEWVKVQVARECDDEYGFKAFYELITGKELPKHAFEWVKRVYFARKNNRGIVIEAFRGSTKTTTLTIMFTAFRVGKEPERANLLIQVGDDIAMNNAKQIADIIENNPMWKVVYPHVVPDYERGWGAGGYEVKRTDIGYDEWRAMNVKRKDPTFVGVGYKSRAIIGKHPDGVLVIDDIHDENNTASSKELTMVRDILKGTIFPVMTPETWVIFIGTPWTEDDVLHYVASTGQFDHVRTPVYIEKNGRKVLVWEKFNNEELRKRAYMSGTHQFARMYLLDLRRAKTSVFKYVLYPNAMVKSDWAMVGGVDYAGTWDVWRLKEGKGDYFAMCYIAKLPDGGAVVVDGVLDRCTQAQAETYITRAQNIYPNWLRTVVEGDGFNEGFVAVIKRNPYLRVVPMKTSHKSKYHRLVIEMSPWLENGTVRISDAETPYLVELRRELDEYPYCEHDDALDALYWALRAIPDVLVMPREHDALPSFMRMKPVNPFIALAKEYR